MASAPSLYPQTPREFSQNGHAYAQGPMGPYDGGSVNSTPATVVAPTPPPPHPSAFASAQSQQAAAASTQAKYYSDGIKPQIYTAVYSNVSVFEMEVNGVSVMRRRNDSWLNATQILKVAGVDKGKRTKVLEKEILTGQHEKVQGGYGKYQGTWVNYHRGREFCRQYGVEQLLLPLLEYDVNNDGATGLPPGMETPTKEQAMAAQRKRLYGADANRSTSQSGRGTYFKNMSNTAANAIQALNRTRMDSPSHMDGRRSIGPPRQSQQSFSQDGLFPRNSQQSMPSMPSQDSFSTGAVLSQAASFADFAEPGSQEPPRKRIRPSPQSSFVTQYDGMDVSMQDPSPTDPSQSFFAHGQSFIMPKPAIFGLDPLPFPQGPLEEQKKEDLLDLFVDSNCDNFDDHPAFLRLSGEEFQMPIDQSCNTVLHWAATLARIPLVKKLLARGFDMRRTNSGGETALIAACKARNNLDKSSFPDLLELLGPSIEVRDGRGRTLLHHIAVSSAMKGRSAVGRYYLESLLEYVIKQGTTPHNTALDENGQEQVPPVNLARFMTDIVNAQDKAGDTALNLAARTSTTSIIDQLIEVGADPHIANRGGLAPVDFGVAADSSQPVNGNSVNVFDLGLANNSAASPLPSFEEAEKSFMSTVQNVLAQSKADFQAEIKEKNELLDNTNAALKASGASLTEEKRKLEELRSRTREREKLEQQIANLKRGIQAMRLQLAKDQPNAPIQSLVAVGEADKGLEHDGQLAYLQALFPTGADPTLQFTQEQANVLAGLERAAVLAGRVKAYQDHNNALETKAKELKAKSHELEERYKKIVSLCTGAHVDKVDELLDGLVQAVISEQKEMSDGNELARHLMLVSALATTTTTTTTVVHVPRGLSIDALGAMAPGRVRRWLQRRQSTTTGAGALPSSPSALNATIAEACITTLDNITDITNEAGMAACYNILSHNVALGTFQADLRLYKAKDQTGDFTGVTVGQMLVDLVYPPCTTFTLLKKRSLTTRALDTMSELQQYTLSGTFTSGVDTAKLNETELMALMLPRISVVAAKPNSDIPISTNITTTDIAFFVIGDFQNQFSPVLTTEAFQKQAILQSKHFTLPGTTLGIFPTGLIITCLLGFDAAIHAEKVPFISGVSSRLTFLLRDESKHLSFLKIGYTALEAFLQANCTGPPLDFDPEEAIFAPIYRDEHLPELKKELLRSLAVDGSAVYPLTPHIELFWLARLVLTNATLAEEGFNGRRARFRVTMWQQKLLSEKSDKLQDCLYMDGDVLYHQLSSRLGLGAATAEHQFVEFLTERAQARIYYGDDEKARADLALASKTRHFYFALTGALGKRTKYQDRDISQLVVLAKSRDFEPEVYSSRHSSRHNSRADPSRSRAGSRDDSAAHAQHSTSHARTGPPSPKLEHHVSPLAAAPIQPQNLPLNDDTLLEKIKFKTDVPHEPQMTNPVGTDLLPPRLADLSPDNQPLLFPLDSIILLAIASSIQNTSPSDGLTREETLPYAERVLQGGSSNWQVYTQALLVRSRIEGYKSRTAQRGLLQLQACVDQLIAETTGTKPDYADEGTGAATDSSPSTFLPKLEASESASVAERLQYIYQLSPPLRWELEAELAQRWTAMGGLKTALEIYQRLQMDAEVALCLAATNQETEAKKLLVDLLFDPSSTSSLAEGSTEVKLRTPTHPDSPRLLCILGDITSVPAYYQLAWTASGKKYGRAQRSLGRYFATQRKFEDAQAAYKLVLERGRLDRGTWFALGCVQLQLSDWKGAAESFKRCISIDDQDAEAWSNLAIALLRLPVEDESEDGPPSHVSSTAVSSTASSIIGSPGKDEEHEGALSSVVDLYKNKRAALRALRRAATLKHDDPRIWDNYLTVAASIPPSQGTPWSEIVQALSMVVQLRGSKEGESCIDVKILGVVVEHVTEELCYPSESLDDDEVVEADDKQAAKLPYTARALTTLVDKQIAPLATSSVPLIRLLARVATWRRRPADALGLYEKAWRAVTNKPGVYETEAGWKDVVAGTELLVAKYRELGDLERERTGGKVEANWRFKARTALRGVAGRGKETWEDTQEYSRLQDALAAL
ncbi:hypothetical protein DV735_g3353, partial [Chaetothyriales sp. CBS 134920]